MLYCVETWSDIHQAWSPDLELPTYGGEVIPFNTEAEAWAWVERFKTETAWRAKLQYRVSPYPEYED
jgi:hypothetical protein